jgi:quinol monooxygenase YgiN
MPVFMTARFVIRPEAREKCEQAIRQFVAYVKDNEPGTLRYTSLQQADDPTRYLHFFIFQDQAARDLHASSEGVKRFTDVLYPETLGPVEFTEYAVVATT